MHNYPGQITLNHKFGKALHEIAKKCNTIVEIGTFYGTGSTKCIHLAMTRPEQRLTTVDFNETTIQHARNLYRRDKRVSIVYGTLALPEEFDAFAYPDPNFRQYYEPEKLHNAKSPYVLHLIPDKIDLLLIDGGCWTSRAEFSKLYKRCSIIALDDTSKEREQKNWQNRLSLMEMGWKCLHDDLDERNGWAIFERP